MPQVSLKIIGDISGEYALEMFKLCQDLKLDERIEFKGYIRNGAELLEEYRSSDIFILPSLSEGFPRVIFEAMSQSLPIITTEIPNIHNRIGGKNLVCFVPPCQSDAISKAIELIVHNSSLRESLIDEGRQFVRDIIGGEKAHEQFLRVADNILSTKESNSLYS